MSNTIIETHNLTKIYKLKGSKKSVLALDDVNLSIKEREIFGLLGPNGAGKTTLISILSTLIQPTNGYALIKGDNIVNSPRKAKSHIALMLDSSMLYYRITGYENLRFFCKIYKVFNYREKIKKIAEQFGLTKWLDQYVENFSSGMKMKLALCRTLLLERDILILDEPTLGLDVKSVSFIIEQLKNVKSTIFLTSHDMNVVEKLCDRIAFIDKGKIINIGTQKDLSNLIQSDIKLEIQIFKNKNELKRELEEQNYVNDITEYDQGLIISFNNRDYYKDIFSILMKYNVQKIKELDLKLEDIFLKFYE